MNEIRDINVDTSRKHNADYFTFGTVNSFDYGIYITGIEIGNTPERDVSFVKVPGRNGDLMLDNKRWNNINITYRCAIATGFASRFDAFKNALLSQSGYQRLTDTIYTDVFRLGIVQEPVVPEVRRKNKTGTFDIVFHCKPQRFLISGETVRTMTADGTVYNEGSFPSRPIITIHGNGASWLEVGSTFIDILELSDHVTIDCETMTAYRQIGNGAVENCNSHIYCTEFPELLPGENLLFWGSNITSVEIIPRGWIL